MDQYTYYGLSIADRSLYDAQDYTNAQMNASVLKITSMGNLMQNRFLPVAGPYESESMNRKLAAAKCYLAERGQKNPDTEVG